MSHGVPSMEYSVVTLSRSPNICQAVGQQQQHLLHQSIATYLPTALYTVALGYPMLYT